MFLIMRLDMRLSVRFRKTRSRYKKTTIVPRTMGALGYVMQTPEEEKYLNTKKELEAMLVGALAGRAAEEIVRYCDDRSVQ